LDVEEVDRDMYELSSLLLPLLFALFQWLFFIVAVVFQQMLEGV
jgi:uncharacterized membrane protein YhdT